MNLTAQEDKQIRFYTGKALEISLKMLALIGSILSLAYVMLLAFVLKKWPSDDDFLSLVTLTMLIAQCVFMLGACRLIRSLVARLRDPKPSPTTSSQV